MKNDLRVLKTKASLQEALVKLLKEKTLDKITISALCKLAQINRGTFYLHYEGVVDLFEEYFKNIIDDLSNAYYEPYRLTDYKIENLEPNMVRIFHHVEKYQDFYKIVFDQNTPLMYYYQLFEIVNNYIIDSMPTLTSANDVESTYKASYQTNAIVGMIIQWIGRDFKETPNEMNKLLLEFTKNSF